MPEVPRGQASWEECLAHKVRMAEFELRLDIDNQTRWCLRYFFSLFFFLPPLADVDGRNWPLMVEIDCYNPTLAVDGRNRPLPIDFGWQGCDHVILWVPRSDGADSTCIVPKLKGVEAYAPYLDETFDGGTKGTELALVKLGSEGFSTGQEDAETDTLEEY
ncbi:hypothetical protein GW17_00017634, partial [Ensete ventricosum]